MEGTATVRIIYCPSPYKGGKHCQRFRVPERVTFPLQDRPRSRICSCCVCVDRRRGGFQRTRAGEQMPLLLGGRSAILRRRRERKRAAELVAGARELSRAEVEQAVRDWRDRLSERSAL